MKIELTNEQIGRAYLQHAQGIPHETNRQLAFARAVIAAHEAAQPIGGNAVTVPPATLASWADEVDAKDAAMAALKADYLRACQTVAAMHEAATGRTGEAPWLGVVEDVAEVRKDAERYRFLASEAYEAVIPHGAKINGSRTAWITKLHPGLSFSEAIDAAIAQEVQPEGNFSNHHLYIGSRKTTAQAVQASGKTGTV